MAELRRLCDVVKGGDYVRYFPPKKVHVVPAAMSGFSRDQCFKVENVTEWRVFCSDSENVLLTNPEVEVYLHLKGADGAKNARDIINGVCQAFVNPEFAVCGRSLGWNPSCKTKPIERYLFSRKGTSVPPYVEDEYLEEEVVLAQKAGLLPQFDSVWIASRCMCSGGAFGVRNMDNKGKMWCIPLIEYAGFGRPGNVMFKNKSYYEFDKAYRICPTVLLKSDVVVTGGEGTKQSLYTIAV